MLRLKRIVASFIFLIAINFAASAGEGMWLPQLLQALNEGEMQSMGMKMTAEDIYSVNKGSLKDAIVHFGGFCTSEIISNQGLLLTNHHCGYGQIQAHSSLEDNYLKNGFWASSQKEEKANPGLFVRFIESIEEVTAKILNGVEDGMTENERMQKIEANINALKAKFRLTAFQEIIIRPFYNGNQYFLFRTIKYTDIRLVGAPPESIGKFGADTDNWVWPRHTGDFSLFRIYANANNQPADYSEDNIPFTPKHYLPISLDGVEEGDFTLVFGFPGRTRQYLPAVAIEQVRDVLDPAKIGIRQIALDIMEKYMREDEEIRLQYSSKFARIANGWKKWIGESEGLRKYHAIEKKIALQTEFTQKADPKYQNILPEFKTLYTDIESAAKARDFYYETALRNIEITRLAYYLNKLVTVYDNNGAEEYEIYKKDRILPMIEDFYKNYNATIDKEVFVALMNHYKENMNAKYWPKALMVKMNIENIFDNCGFLSMEQLNKTLAMDAEASVASLKSDPVMNLYLSWKDIYSSQIAPTYDAINNQLDSLQRAYMKALMETFPNKRLYPDANSTMRVSYGQVNGYAPRDAINYSPVSHLDGVIEKYVPGDYEFDVDAKLIQLYETKDYGQYADKNGKIPVCFLGSNHTTGGNSGSPAIDAHGNLIGLNFDRVWEGTMSDLNYDPKICRNIMVDVRYVLFIIDKFASAGYLVEEMTLVHPKNDK